MKQRDELFSNAEHEAELAKRFTESCSESHAARSRGVHFGVAGCGLAAAAHRRSKMQRERREAEREEEGSQGSVAMRLRSDTDL